MLNNVSQFLAKFEDITFNNTDEDKSIMGSFRGHEIKISYQLKVESTFLHGYVVQVVVNVSVDGTYARGWGCVDSDENGVALQWIHTRMNKALSMKMKEESYKRDEAKRLLDSLV
jgi:hypothetical protein